MTTPNQHRALITIAMVALLLGLAPSANAYFDRGSGYAHKDDNCRTGPIDNKDRLRLGDPVTVVLWGSLRSPDYTESLIKHVANWRYSAFDSPSYFWDHRECVENNLSGATKRTTCRGCNRWHTRGRLQSHDNDVGRWAVMTPHRDVWQDEYRDSRGRLRCHGISIPALPDPQGKHYVHRSTGRGSGFDRGRERFASDIAGSSAIRRTSRVEWGNTVTTKQCNGQLAGSNGYVVYVKVGR